jgi:hypothetical protein
MTIYDNPEVMFRDIIGFLRVVPGGELYPADDPNRQMFGYTHIPECSLCQREDRNTLWEFPVIALRTHRDSISAPILTLLQSAEGRRQLTRVMIEQASHDTMTEEEAEERRHSWTSQVQRARRTQTPVERVVEGAKATIGKFLQGREAAKEPEPPSRYDRLNEDDDG